MILITLGTHDKDFTRLLDLVQKQIDKGNIKDKVVVQAGHTKYESNDMEIFDLIDREKFSELISQCDLLITHGGVGSIITSPFPSLANGTVIVSLSSFSCELDGSAP